MITIEPLAEMKTQVGGGYVVLGGGIAGLTIARELLKQGCQVTLVEKSAVVGGLARTFERDGFRFDIGGHRFHSNNPSVVQWLKDLLGTDLLTVPRLSHIYLNQQFVDYPIQFPGALTIFSPLEAAQMVSSYLMAKLTERQRWDVSFEDWVIKRYGRALYEVFFQPYTEKVWGIAGDRLSAAWASQRIGIPSMWRAVRHAIFPPQNAPATAISQFYYPREGFGLIPETLRQEITRLGGTLYTSTTVSKLVPLASGGFEVTLCHGNEHRQTITGDQVISTIPLNYLLAAIPAELGSREVLAQYDLEYRDLICLFLVIDKPQVSQDSWTYFPDRNLMFGRTHEPKNWSPAMIPDDRYTSLAVEIFASRGEPTWQMSDEAIADTVVSQMHEIGWVSKPDVLKSWVLRVPYAYPVYTIGYQEKLQQVKDYLGQWPNLHLLGRTGSFRYMNSDGVIEDVFRLMAELFPADPRAVRSLASATGRWL